MQVALSVLHYWEWMEQLAYQYGYLGIFILSLIGAISVFFPIPYTIFIYMLGPFLDPFLIALAGGLGSTAGEAIGYVLGYFGRTLMSEERRKKMDYILKLFEHYGFIAVFFFALTPLPDDLLIIPLGIMHYNPVKFFIACVMGKTLMCLILALGGRFSIGIIKSIFGSDEGWIAFIINFLLLSVIIVFMLRVDWEKVFFKHLGGDEKKNR